MSAIPSDIAKYTTDGVLVTSPTDPAISAAIAADHIDARDGIDTEIEMFYDDPADAQAMLDERFVYARKVAPVHVGIELSESIDLGGVIPVAPAVPSFRVIDEENQVNEIVRTRAYAQDMGTDRFSIEVQA